MNINIKYYRSIQFKNKHKENNFELKYLLRNSLI